MEKRDQIILRPAVPAVTLDEALLSMSTFANGCDYRLVFEGDHIFLEFGCYGVHVNLAQGLERVLLHYLQGHGQQQREVVGAHPETIAALKMRKPCQCCGGFLFKDKAA